jgi:hypothetical protein
MNTDHPKTTRSYLVSIVFFGSLFLLFIPFEDTGSNSMWPRYFALGVSFLFLIPILIARKIKFSVPSVYIFIALCDVAFTTFLRPVSFIYSLFVMANLALAILIYECGRKWPAEFSTGVVWLLIANVTAIFAQALLFFLAGGPIFDFHELLFGSSGRAAFDFLNVNRFSGLQVEPGTYANNMAFLLAILVFTREFSKKLYLLSAFALISILLTSSATSIYFGCVFLLLLPLLWRTGVKKSHLVILALLMVGYFSFSNMAGHLHERFSQHDDGSLTIWMTGMTSYWNTSLEDKLIGLGFEHPPCSNCYYQDLGVVINLLSGGGLLMLLILVTFFLRMIKFNGLLLSLVILAIPMNSRMYYYEPPVWILFSLALTRLRRPPPASRSRPLALPNLLLQHDFRPTLAPGERIGR